MPTKTRNLKNQNLWGGVRTDKRAEQGWRNRPDPQNLTPQRASIGRGEEGLF